MKRATAVLLIWCIITFFNSCGEIFSNANNINSTNQEPDNIISLNRVNWENYCKINAYFLGVEDNKIITSCWLEVDNNYKVYEEIFIEITVKFDLFYYTTLLGGDETHISRAYIYSGFASDNLEELSCQETFYNEYSKELFRGEEPEISVHRIYGKICK